MIDYNVVKKHLKFNINFFDKFNKDILIYTNEDLKSLVDKNWIKWSQGNFYITKLIAIKFLKKSQGTFWIIKNNSSIWRVKKEISSYENSSNKYFINFSLNYKLNYFYRKTLSSKYEVADYIQNEFSKIELAFLNNHTITFEHVNTHMERYNYAQTKSQEFKKGITNYLIKAYDKFSKEFRVTKEEKMDLYLWKLQTGQNIFKIVKFLQKYDCSFTYNKSTKTHYIKKAYNTVIIAPFLKHNMARFTYKGNVSFDNIQCNVKHSDITYPKLLLKYVGPILNISLDFLQMNTKEFSYYLDQVMNKLKI